jgi:hypothetical protein
MRAGPPLVLVAAALLLAACVGQGGGGGSQAGDAPAGSVLVVVELAVPYEPEAGLSPEEREAQRAAIAQAQDALLAELGGHAELAGRPERLPQLALRVDREGLRLLEASPSVRRVEPDEPEPPAGS